jgi:hypothetical protein
MKVISIMEPWSTLIAIGEKAFETKSWSTKHSLNQGLYTNDEGATAAAPFSDDHKILIIS